jgi:RsiW-degrading membrane proteinase PrsW (M82 family)
MSNLNAILILLGVPVIESTLHTTVEIMVSLIPVFAFLLALILLDSYKLITLRSILTAVLFGSVFAIICYVAGSWYTAELNINNQTNSRYFAPVIEEICKAAYLIWMIKKMKVGFMVDAAIYGFAIGAGFAFVENALFLHTRTQINLFVLIIRGLGTAVMHGGTTAIFGILAKKLDEQVRSPKLHLFFPGLIIAIVIHSFFNHFLLSVVLITLLQLVLLPLIIYGVFKRSEQSLRTWMEVGLDTDVQLLEYISTGKVATTRIGKYLQTLKKNFPGEIIADMLCYIRVYLELAIRAKGVLLMQESGFKASLEKDVQEKFQELKYLEHSLGKTGKRALNPVFKMSSRDLWQLYLLNTK